MTPALEFRYLDVIVRVFKRLPAESRRWLLSRLQDDSSGCTHPADGVMWNEFNQVTQCHRCGAHIDGGGER